MLVLLRHHFKVRRVVRFAVLGILKPASQLQKLCKFLFSVFSFGLISLFQELKASRVEFGQFLANSGVLVPIILNDNVEESGENYPEFRREILDKILSITAERSGAHGSSWQIVEAEGLQRLELIPSQPAVWMILQDGAREDFPTWTEAGCRVHVIQAMIIMKKNLTGGEKSDHTSLRSPLDPWNIRPNSGFFPRRKDSDSHVVRYCRDRKRHNEERRNDYFRRKQDAMVSYNSRAESQDPNDESLRKTFTRYRSPTSYREDIHRSHLKISLAIVLVLKTDDFEDAELQALLDEDSTQMQEKLAKQLQVSQGAKGELNQIFTVLTEWNIGSLWKFDENVSNTVFVRNLPGKRNTAPAQVPSLFDRPRPLRESVSMATSCFRGHAAGDISGMLDAEFGYPPPSRMSPPAAFGANYATLTPLQPLPPISTMSDKFSPYGHHHHHPGPGNGGFALMQNNPLGGMGMNMNHSYHHSQYDKLGSMGMNMNPAPHHVMGGGPSNGLSGPHQSGIPSPPYSQNGGLHSPDKSLSPAAIGYDPYLHHTRGGAGGHDRGLGSPQSPAVTLHTPSSLFGGPLHAPATPPEPHDIKPLASPVLAVQASAGGHLGSKMPSGASGGLCKGPGAGGEEVEEINTKELAQRISAELKRYSIPQAIFAQRVLCRSQGTLSDLLRNPKPWSKLKSGRETFRRMYKWLEEPEFQRMSALRLAGECHTILRTP
ncbi:ONECUT2 [Cordylochernes scorpioides]|uniref:ONECUT2 n=1 Tax=Cordylochernes scorpioides TaxID=51811 RepID=A0ABY6K6T3_9ARAC|nr:ONECUT2 [Cordylochernes scorpioides]